MIIDLDKIPSGTVVRPHRLRHLNAPEGVWMDARKFWDDVAFRKYQRIEGVTYTFNLELAQTLPFSRVIIGNHLCFPYEVTTPQCKLCTNNHAKMYLAYTSPRQRYPAVVYVGSLNLVQPTLIETMTAISDREYCRTAAKFFSQLWMECL